MLERLAKVVEGHAKLLEANNCEVESRHVAEVKLRTARDMIRVTLATINRLTEAIIPSANTKAEYGWELTFPMLKTDEEGNERNRHYAVPWTTINDIMSAIRKRVGFV